MSKLFSYAIGLNEPLSLEIRAKGAKLSDEELLKLINKVFDFRVTNIIKELDLKKCEVCRTFLLWAFWKERLSLGGSR